MVIDVHTHLGWDQVFEVDFTREELLASQEQFGVDATIVQPGTCHRLPDAMKQHDAIAGLCRDYPGRFYGMANPNPHLTEDEYRAEATRCVKELGFVGIKIHPAAHALNPSSRDGRQAIRVAEELGVPVMIHTGSGVPFALPTNIMPVARDFPNVTFVIAHSGMMFFAGDALNVAVAYPNVYLETTWTAGFLLRKFAGTVGAGRCLFGSDHADNAGAELAKVRTAGLSEDDTALVLGGTAARIYKLPR